MGHRWRGDIDGDTDADIDTDAGTDAGNDGDDSSCGCDTVGSTTSLSSLAVSLLNALFR